LFFFLLFVFARDRSAAVATEAIELELTTAQLLVDCIFCVFRLFVRARGGVYFCVASPFFDQLFSRRKGSKRQKYLMSQTNKKTLL
jgi:hypothetical protein